MTPRRSNDHNYRVKDEVGQNIAERINRLHHAHISQNNTRKLAGGHPLVMPSSNVWSGNAEQFQPQGILKTPRQCKTLEVAEFASWVDWPTENEPIELGEKENGVKPESPAIAAGTWQTFLESRQDESPLRQEFTRRGQAESEVSESSMHRRVSNFVDRVSRLSAPVGASSKEISEYHHIVGMVNRTFSPGRKCKPHFDRQTIKTVAFGSGLPMQVIEDILDSDKDGSGEDDRCTNTMSSSSSHEVSGFMKALWEGSYLNEEVPETNTAADWERALGDVPSNESDLFNHFPGGLNQFASDRSLREEDLQSLSSTSYGEGKSVWDDANLSTYDEFSPPSLPSYLNPSNTRNMAASGRLGISKRIDVFQQNLWSPQGSQPTSSVEMKEKSIRSLHQNRQVLNNDRGESETPAQRFHNWNPKESHFTNKDENTSRKDLMKVEGERQGETQQDISHRCTSASEEPPSCGKGQCSSLSKQESGDENESDEYANSFRSSENGATNPRGQQIQDSSGNANGFLDTKSEKKNEVQIAAVRHTKLSEKHGNELPLYRGLRSSESGNHYPRTPSTDRPTLSRSRYRPEQPITLQKKHSYPGCEPRHPEAVPLASPTLISREVKGHEARKRAGREFLPRQSSEPIISKNGEQTIYRFKNSRNYLLQNVLENGSEMSEVFDGIQENSVESREGANQFSVVHVPVPPPPPPPPSPPEVIQTFPKKKSESSLFEDSDPSSCSGLETNDDEVDNVTETVSAITSCNETSVVTANALHEGACSPRRISEYFPTASNAVDCVRDYAQQQSAFQKRIRPSLRGREHKSSYWQTYSTVKTLGSFDSVSVINESVATNETPRLSNGQYIDDGLYERMPRLEEYHREPSNKSFDERIQRTKTDGGYFHSARGVNPHEIYRNQSYGGYPVLHEPAPYSRVPSFGPKRDPSRFIRHDPRRPTYLDRELPESAADNLLYVMGPLLSGDTADESLETLCTEEETKASQGKKASKFCSLVCGDFDLSIALSGCCKK